MTTKLSLKNDLEFVQKLNSSVAYYKETELKHFKLTQFTINRKELSGDRLNIDYRVFNNQKWTGFSFDYLEFNTCTFKNIQFDLFTSSGCIFLECLFIECTFSNCSIHETDFQKCSFNNCKIENCTFGDCSLLNNIFFDCHEIYDTYFGSCYYEENIFDQSDVSFCRFESMLSGNLKAQVTFFRSAITGTTFNSFDLRNSLFKTCIHSKNIFANTLLSQDTFSLDNKNENSEFSLIDLHSLTKSDKLNSLILENIFGIKEQDIKDYAMGMTQDIKLQSVFISYSFTDKKFVNKLNESLKRKGVFTFLWEKNASGGKRLQEIMAENINFYDRVLFVASEASIKSAACQYELTQARLKQDKMWKTIFIPIHTDDFLFRLKKEDIRPKENREEYWQNIQDLKEINSLDFKKFKIPKASNENKFEEMIYKLVEALRK